MKIDFCYYSIFNCVLKSTLELPELPVYRGVIEQDLMVLEFALNSSQLSEEKAPDWFHHWYIPNGKISLSCGKSPEFYYLRFPGLVDFELSIGDYSIVAYPCGTLDRFILRHLLLDQVIPRLLSHLGQLILHASAVEFNDAALLFLGETGHGKSTLATALQKQGCRLLTDDCVSVEIESGLITCVPNYPGVRLWQNSIDALGLGNKKQESFNNVNKSRIYFDVENVMGNIKIPVTAIYLISSLKDNHLATDFSITQLSGVDKLIELTRHCFPLDISDSVAMRKQFDTIGLLGKAENLKIAYLQYQRDYVQLPGICKSILNHHAI